MRFEVTSPEWRGLPLFAELPVEVPDLSTLTAGADIVAVYYPVVDTFLSHAVSPLSILITIFKIRVLWNVDLNINPVDVVVAE
jgi:hypothetical protein